MPSTPTTRNRLEKQAAGENSNTWGAPKLNTVIDLLDASLDGLTTKALTGNYSLTSTNYAADESRNRVLRFTGTGTFTVTIPGVEKWYIVDNQCTGDLTITTGSGTTAVIPTATMSAVTCDGTNVKRLSPATLADVAGLQAALDLKANIASPSFTGSVVVNGSGSSAIFNVRSANGEATFMGDTSAGSEKIYLYSRISPNLSVVSSQNSTLRIQTNDAYAVELATAGVARYSVDSAGIHYVNGGSPLGVQNILHASGGYAVAIQNTSNTERLYLTSRASAGVSSVVADNALLRMVSTTGSVEFWPANTYAGGVSDSGLNVTFTGVANYVAGAAANVYVNPSTGRLSQITSSRVFKKDIAPYVPGGSIDDLAPVFYRVINEGDGPTYAGLIAEDVHAAGFTEFVAYNGEGQPHSVHYPNMVALLIHEVQGLRRRVSDLEAR